MPHSEKSAPALPAEPDRRRRLHGAAAVLALCVIGLWAWSGGLTGPYHFDDYATPLGDPASQSLAGLRQYLPLTLRPVTKLSYALEADAGLSAKPALRRVVSLLLHLLSAALLYLLIAQLAPAAAPLAAAFLAAMWFIHPVHELLGYWKACSVKPDPDIAMDVVDDDLAALDPRADEDDLAPLTPEPKHKAKKSKKKPKRSHKKHGGH